MGNRAAVKFVMTCVALATILLFLAVTLYLDYQMHSYYSSSQLGGA